MHSLVDSVSVTGLVSFNLKGLVLIRIKFHHVNYGETSIAYLLYLGGCPGFLPLLQLVQDVELHWGTASVAD